MATMTVESVEIIELVTVEVITTDTTIASIVTASYNSSPSYHVLKTGEKYKKSMIDVVGFGSGKKLGRLNYFSISQSELFFLLHAAP